MAPTLLFNFCKYINMIKIMHLCMWMDAWFWSFHIFPLQITFGPHLIHFILMAEVMLVTTMVVKAAVAGGGDGGGGDWHSKIFWYTFYNCKIIVHVQILLTFCTSVQIRFSEVGLFSNILSIYPLIVFKFCFPTLMILRFPKGYRPVIAPKLFQTQSPIQWWPRKMASKNQRPTY